MPTSPYFNEDAIKPGLVTPALVDLLREMLASIRESLNLEVAAPLDMGNSGGNKVISIQLPPETIVKITSATPNAQGFYTALISTFNIQTNQWVDGPFQVYVKDANG